MLFIILKFVNSYIRLTGWRLILLCIICSLLFLTCEESGEPVTPGEINEDKVIEVLDIPDQTVLQGKAFDSFCLDSFLVAKKNEGISWAVSGNNDLIVNIDTNNQITIETPTERWIGSETIKFTATQNAYSDSNFTTYKVKSIVILISLDGFRWDYLSRTATNNFDAIVGSGVKAKSLIPVFPTTTFPNHLSIITGLYPENHGIVSNRMYDEEWDAWYYIGEGSVPVTESRWYEGEPFWVTAEKQGYTTATYFWPGSEAVINGEQPTYWYPYDGSVPNEEIINQVLEWLEFPIENRPTFITFYLNDANHWGHIYGPESSEMNAIIQGLDNDIGMLIDGLNERDIFENVNIIITADHGMTSQSRDRVIFLDDYINLEDVMVIDWTTMATIRPNEGLVSVIYNNLSGAHERMNVYWKEEMPERLHYRNHRRIPPIICIADQGWSITTREYFNNNPDAYTGGTHGYDPIYEDMQGIFICRGPSFKDGLIVDSFQNIHIYNILAYVLGVIPTENDGDLNYVRAMLEP